MFALANRGGADGFFYGDWIRDTPRFPAATTACGPCTSRSSWRRNKGTPADLSVESDRDLFGKGCVFDAQMMMEILTADPTEDVVQ